MRIEAHGYTETQPAYNHVGYTSACFDSYFPAGARTYPTLLLALMVCGIAASLMLGRRARSVTGRLAAGCAAGMLGAVAVAWATADPAREMSPEFYTTLYNLEAATALTDEWEAELGRLPTVEEWTEKMEGRECRLDGWGYPFRYTSAVDREKMWVHWVPTYRIVSDPKARGETDEWVWAIGSEWLGEDGVFGTDDDYRGLKHELPKVGLDPETYPHAREPREVEAEQ